MRNIAQYPITSQEIEDCLRRLAKENDPAITQRIGDMTPILLEAAANIVRRAGFVLNGYTGSPL